DLEQPSYGLAEYDVVGRFQFGTEILEIPSRFVQSTLAHVRIESLRHQVTPFRGQLRISPFNSQGHQLRGRVLIDEADLRREEAHRLANVGHMLRALPGILLCVPSLLEQNRQQVLILDKRCNELTRSQDRDCFGVATTPDADASQSNHTAELPGQAVARPLLLRGSE